MKTSSWVLLGLGAAALYYVVKQSAAVIQNAAPAVGPSASSDVEPTITTRLLPPFQMTATQGVLTPSGKFMLVN